MKNRLLTLFGIALFLLPICASAASCPNLTRNLSFGSRGNDVVQLQQFLISQSLLVAGNDTGYFGRLTEAAVKRFQCREMQICSGSAGSNGYGAVGPRTRTTIARMCSQSSQSSSSSASVGTAQTGGQTSGTGTGQTSTINFSASPMSGTAPLRVVFRVAAEWTSMFSIEFGDGQNSLLQNNCPGGGIGACGQPTTEHTYLNSGTFIARLIKSDPGGCGANADPRCLGAPASRQVLGTITITVSSSAPICEHAAPPQGCYWQSGATCAEDRLACGTTNAACSFNNQSIPHGNSVTAYQASSVPNGSQCISQIRSCNNGTLSGSYQYVSCTVGSIQCTPDSSSPQTRTSTPCQSGQIGTITERRTSSCSTGATTPVWSEWTMVTNTCHVPQITSTQNNLLSGLNNGATTSVPAGWTPDFYSAELVKWNNKTRMYFGGWYESNPPNFADDIYVADCEYKGGPCTNVRTVIDASQYGGPVNDPSVVLIQPADGSRAYYIMYMTCVKEGAPSGGVCYSTSWADDGINWGIPGVLVTNAWLPSATLKDGRVILFLSRYPTNELVVYDLGTSGTNIGQASSLTFTGLPAPLGGNAFYINVDAKWRPGANKYQMVAEGPDTTDGAWPWPSAIDYLESTDGVNWRVVNLAVMKRTPDQVRVGTPAMHPDNEHWVYFGSTEMTNSTGFKINYGEWSVQ